jgi:hypothetical protein
MTYRKYLAWLTRIVIEPGRQGPFPKIPVVLDSEWAKLICGSSPTSADPTSYSSPARCVSTTFWFFYRGKLSCAQSFTGWTDVWSACQTPSSDISIVFTPSPTRSGAFHRYT